MSQQCARLLNSQSISTGARYWPTYVSDGVACHCKTIPPHRSGSIDGCSKPRSWKPCCTDVSRGSPPWLISPYVARLTTDCPSAASDGKEHFAMVYHTLSYADALAQTCCENVGTTVQERRIRSARFVARMDNEGLPKRVMFGANWTGKRSLGCARTGPNVLPRARSIVDQLAQRSEALNVGSEEAG